MGQRTVKVLLASRHPEVPEALEGIEIAGGRLEVTEAVTTSGAYGALVGCNLAIVDIDALVESPSLSRSGFLAAVEDAGIPRCSGEEFCSDPQGWLEKGLASAGIIEALPPRTAAIASFSGGVGKTTLTLHTARYVAQELKLPVAAVEVCFGTSAFKALTGNAELPDIYDVITQGVETAKWHGVTLLPMNYETARLLLGRQDEVKEAFRKMAREHILTIFDAHASHPFWPSVEEIAHVVVALADTRLDAVANAVKLSSSLNGKAKVVLNKMGWGDKVALAGVERAAEVPYIKGADNLDGSLGPRLMRVIYPGWRSK